MKTPKMIPYSRYAVALLCAAAATGVRGQQAPAPTPTPALPAEEEILTLNPFEVSSDNDSRYTATSTLAGTRVRTDLRDLASSMSVVTSQFLKDTGATSNESLLVYQTNTEVGGLYGNFAGIGNLQGASENSKLANPNSNTRVRGLDAADNTRDYFLTNIPWDSYTVDRVDLQRGPNSILFGVGSPAGIINTTTIGARLNKSGGRVEASVGSYGSKRFNIDYNQPLIKDELALRIAAVQDDVKFRQDPAFAKSQRIFGAVRYTPQLFSESFADKLSVRINAEAGRLRSNRPRMLPPTDQITSFFDQNIFRRENGKIKLYDPYFTWRLFQQRDRGTKQTPAPLAADPRWYPLPGLNNNGNFGFITYVNGQNAPVSVGTTMGGFGTPFGIDKFGKNDAGIGAFESAQPAAPAGLNQYSLNLHSLDASKFPAAEKNFYKDLSLRDTSIFDFYNKLIDGPNKREWTDFKTFNAAVSQNFIGNRVGFEVVYDYQDSTTGQVNYLGNPFIGVDVNKYNMASVAKYTPSTIKDGFPIEPDVGGGTPNPGAGKAYLSGSGYGNSDQTTRSSVRGTIYGELRGDDLFEKDSFLANLFQKTVITGLLSSDTVDTFHKEWTMERTDVQFSVVQGYNMPGSRQVGYTVYLSDDLTSRTTATGLNIDRLRTRVSPSGQLVANYFDSHWKYSLNPTDPNYVDPAAPYITPLLGATSTQSENPANYVGWTSRGVEIISADHGGLDQSYTKADKARNQLDSKGLTLQSYLWKDTLIPTIGWRKDRISTFGSSSREDPYNGVVNPNFENIAKGKQVSEGETVTWGVVARLPKNLRGKLPLGSDVSAFYNHSKNFRAVNRVGFDGLPIANPQGDSKDYGFVVSALDDRISLKVTQYDTLVTDADLPGSTPLGSNIWFLYGLQGFGTAVALQERAGYAGLSPGSQWRWNTALIDENKWGDPIWENPNSPEVVNHPSTIKTKAAATAWLATLPPQSYFDSFGYELNVAKLQNPDFAIARTGVRNGAWDPLTGGAGDLGAPGGVGKVNGVEPSATITQRSKGYEFEFAAKPLRNWDLVFNAAKTSATRSDLGTSFVAWLEGQKKRLDGPAGDLRVWWGGDKTFRQYYNDLIYGSYLFQKNASGQEAAEIRPWRFNVISNYRFENGALKGVNFGGGYRWQDDAILGYALNNAKDNLDVRRPIKGSSEKGVDLWLGYERNLSKKVKWGVQLNLRNVGEKTHLIPVSVNPDGTAATLRIADGFAWTFRNSFEF